METDNVSAALQTMYLNLIQLAESFGVSESVVEGWIRDEALPHTPDRGRLLFDRAQVADWAARRGLASKAGFLASETSLLAPGLQLEPLLRRGGVWRDVAAADVPALLERIVTALPGATRPVRQLVGQRMRAEGGVTLVPVGWGFALSHPSARITLGRDSGMVALIFVRDALPLEATAPDAVPVTRIAFFIAPSPRAHLDLLGQLSRSLTRGPLRELVIKGATDEEIFRAADAVEAESANRRDREVKP